MDATRTAATAMGMAKQPLQLYPSTTFDYPVPSTSRPASCAQTAHKTAPLTYRRFICHWHSCSFVPTRPHVSTLMSKQTRAQRPARARRARNNTEDTTRTHNRTEPCAGATFCPPPAGILDHHTTSQARYRSRPTAARRSRHSHSAARARSALRGCGALLLLHVDAL